MLPITTVRRLAARLALSASVASLGACSAGASNDETLVNGAAQVVSSTSSFQTFVGNDGQNYFSLVAGKGENVLRSQGYASVAEMKNGIASVIKSGVDPSKYEILQAKNGEFYFNVLADNGEIVATSETYVAPDSNAERAAKTVQAVARHTGANVNVTPAPKRERFEVFTGEDTRAYFYLRAGNGEIVLESEGYGDAHGATNGIDEIRAYSKDATRWSVAETVDGHYTIRLRAGNGEIVARGESYGSKQDAEAAVTTLREMLGRVTATE